jgi:hypothetical protein
VENCDDGGGVYSVAKTVLSKIVGSKARSPVWFEFPMSESEDGLNLRKAEDMMGGNQWIGDKYIILDIPNLHHAAVQLRAYSTKHSLF